MPKGETSGNTRRPQPADTLVCSPSLSLSPLSPCLRHSLSLTCRASVFSICREKRGLRLSNGKQLGEKRGGGDGRESKVRVISLNVRRGTKPSFFDISGLFLKKEGKISRAQKMRSRIPSPPFVCCRLRFAFSISRRTLKLASSSKTWTSCH